MPTILITAGEASGDRLGGALMAALQARRQGLRFIGVGGAEMQAQGLAPLFPMADLAVMGLAEVLPAIPRILARVRALARLAEQERPALVITIDSQDFSARLAAALKPLGVPHLHYVCPKVWAWRQGRVRKLKNLYTHLLSILPFEVPFFAQAGIPTTYVGHPAVTALAGRGAAAPVPQTVALLPGSRGAELARHWPVFLAAFRLLRQTHPGLTGLLTLPDVAALNLCQAAAPWEGGEGIRPVLGANRFAELAQCWAALCKSGTNNLELALLGVPAVVAYRMHPLTYALARRLVKVRYISLPNLILDAPAYPEYLQQAATPANLAAALAQLLEQPAARARQLEQLKRLQGVMQTPHPPAEQAAAVALACLG